MLVGGEFVGTVHRDAEDGEVSYAVQIAILAEDLLLGRDWPPCYSFPVHFRATSLPANWRR